MHWQSQQIEIGQHVQGKNADATVSEPEDIAIRCHMICCHACVQQLCSQRLIGQELRPHIQLCVWHC